jgi:hypothetical protein
MRAYTVGWRFDLPLLAVRGRSADLAHSAGAERKKRRARVNSALLRHSTLAASDTSASGSSFDLQLLIGKNLPPAAGPSFSSLGGGALT